MGGFEQRIRLMKADEKNGLESGIAELFAGKFFKIANAQFQYVVVPSEPGVEMPKNPDIEYVAGFNRLEACEVKCNLQKSDLNDRSIINTLKAAKKQLPKGRAGIVLLRVPEEWIADMELGTSTIEGAVSHFFRTARTTRVSSVFVIVSETKIFPTAEKMAQILRIKQFRNPHCEKGPGICIPTDFSNGVPNWRAFHDLAARELALAAS
jgi:hypothetical protein